MKTFEKKSKMTTPPVRRGRTPVLPSFNPAAQIQRAQIRQVLRSPQVQATLTIGQPNDKYEQEADYVAEQIMRMPKPRMQRKPVEEEKQEQEEFIQTTPFAAQITPIAQRQVEEEEEEPIQTKLLSTEHLILQRQVEEVEEESEATVTLAGPLVVQIVIQRQDETSLSTSGTLTVGDQTFNTLELPNRGNRSTGNWLTAGRIPAGTYSARVRTGGGRGWRLQLEDVERSGTAPIQIHQGNVPNHTTGCILAGTGSGENRVNDSRNAMAQIRQIVQNAGPGATIQVTIIDPPLEAEGTEKGVIHPKEFRSQAPEIIPILESRIQTIKGGAQPLPESTRNYFEPRFGYEFRNVRIHTDVQAAETTRALNARAFTLGHDIVFGAGQYAPKTTEGKRLLAHELTHVVQQDHWYPNRNLLIQRKPNLRRYGYESVLLKNVPFNAECEQYLKFENSIYEALRNRLGNINFPEPWAADIMKRSNFERDVYIPLMNWATPPKWVDLVVDVHGGTTLHKSYVWFDVLKASHEKEEEISIREEWPERKMVAGEQNILQRLAELGRVARTEGADGKEFKRVLDQFRRVLRKHMEAVRAGEPLLGGVELVMIALMLWSKDPGNKWGEGIWESEDLVLSASEYATIPAFSYKCNAFVAEVLYLAFGLIHKVTSSSDSPLSPVSAEPGKYFPYAAKAWSDKNIEIPQFRVVEEPLMGDIWSNGKHVGIYLGEYGSKRLYISARDLWFWQSIYGESEELQKRHGIQITYMPKGGVFRRYTGVMPIR